MEYFLFPNSNVVSVAVERRSAERGSADHLREQDNSQRDMYSSSRAADLAGFRRRPPAHPRAASVDRRKGKSAPAEKATETRKSRDTRKPSETRKSADSKKLSRSRKGPVKSKSASPVKTPPPLKASPSTKGISPLKASPSSKITSPWNASLSAKVDSPSKSSPSVKTSSPVRSSPPMKASLTVKIPANSSVDKNCTKADAEQLYLPTSTFSSDAHTHLSSPSGSPGSTSPWGASPRPTWDSASSPIASDSGPPSLSADQEADQEVTAQSSPAKSTLPRCAVVNFRREGDVVKWVPRARENTGGIAARVRDFDDAFKLEELSSRNFAVGPRFLSSMSAVRSPVLRDAHMRDVRDLPAHPRDDGKWAERARQLSAGNRAAPREAGAPRGAGRAYFGAAIAHAKGSHSANLRNARMASDLSSALLRDPRLVEETIELPGMLPADVHALRIRQSNPFIWTRKRISDLLTRRPSVSAQAWAADRQPVPAPLPHTSERCPRISLSAADFRALAGAPDWSTADVAMRKQSLPPVRTTHKPCSAAAIRKASLPVQPAVPAPRAPPKVKAKPKKRGLRGLFTRRKHAGVLVDPNRQRADEFFEDGEADTLEADSPAQNLRRMVSNWHLRRSSVSEKPRMTGDQYVQFMGRL